MFCSFLTMSKRKVKDDHLPVGECITQVCICQFPPSNLCVLIDTSIWLVNT